MRSSLLKSATALFFGCNVLLSMFGFSALHGSSYTGLRLADKGGAALVTSVDAGSPAHEKVLPNDRLLAIDGRPIKAIAFNSDPDYIRSRKGHGMFWEAQRRLSETVAKGKPVRLLLERNGDRLEVLLTPAPFPLQRALIRTLPVYLVAWTFIGVAYLVLRRKNNEIALVNFFIGALVCVNFLTLAYSSRDILFPLAAFRPLVFINTISYFGFSCLLLHMMLVFPHRKKVLIDRPWLLAAPYALFVLISLVHFSGISDNTHLTKYIATNACMALFFGRLLYDYFKEQNALYKKQIQWVVFGIVSGITFWMSMTAIPVVFGMGFVSQEISVLPTVVYPLCFAFAVTKYRLMDIDTIFDAALVYGATIVILEGIEFAVLGTLSRYISIAHSTPSLSLVGVLMIVFLYVPLRNKVKDGVERLFKRGKYDVEKEVQRFITNLGVRDGASPLEKFAYYARDMFGPSGICIVKFHSDQASAYFSEGKKAGQMAAVLENSSAVIRARFRAGLSAVFGYELASAGVFPDTDPDMENSLFIFLTAGEDEAYLVVLLPKWNQTAYSNKDRNLVRALSRQLSNVLESEERRTSVAKITRPEQSSGILRRERLFEILDNKQNYPVIWVGGPAGSGKSTLVSNWLDSRKRPCIWYNADEGDGDVATFFYYMAIAVKKAGTGTKPLPFFGNEYLTGLPVFARRWFSDLYSRLNPARSAQRRAPGAGEYVIVLDNYQAVPVQSLFHEMIVHGIEAVSAGIQIIIMSRSEPAAPFARLSANGRVLFLGWDDIRLTREESCGIIRMKTGEPVEPDLCERVYAATGGWAAGLVLTLEHTKFKNGDLSSRADLTPGEIFAYFANEIFEKLDTESRMFLLKTSFLPDMTADSAERLTGAGTSWQRLYYLSRNHYFTEKYTGEKTVYRYHPLFRDFLLTKAKSMLSAEELSRLRLNAAALLEEAGQTEDAVKILLETDGRESIVRLILAQARSLIGQGRSRTLQELILALPADMTEKTPWLLYWLGFCQLPAGPAAARSSFEKAFRLFNVQKDDTGALLAWSGAVDTFFYEWNDFSPLDSWISFLDDYMLHKAAFPSLDVETRVSASMAGALIFRRPQHPDLTRWMDRALSKSQTGAGPAVRAQVCIYAFNYYLWMGDLHNCSLMVREIAKTGLETGAEAVALLAKAMEALLHNISADPEKSMCAAREAWEIADKSGIHMWDHMLLANGMYTALNRDDIAGAGEFLSKLEKLLDPSRQFGYFHYHHLAAWYHVRSGSIPNAVTHIEKAMEFALATGAPLSEMLCRLLMSQVLIEAGELEKAGRELFAAGDLIRETGSPMLTFMHLMFSFRLAYDEGKDEQGLKLLRQAMETGRKREYYTLFWWWQPSVVARLCARALEQGIEVQYVRKLIQKRNLTPLDINQESNPQSVVRSLTLEHWPWPLKVFTLGRFEALRLDQPVSIEKKSSRKPIELLKAIVSFGETGGDKEQIIEALWTDAEGDAGNHAFETTLYRLRKLLDAADAILLKNNRLTIDSRFCWIDAWAFEKIFVDAEDRRREEGGKEEKVKQRPSSPRHPVAHSPVHEHLEKALALYKGPFLAGEQESWALSYRERLRGKFLRLIAGLSGHWEQAGKWKKAVECYRKGLEADPLAEEFYQGLMTCYYRLGIRSEAIKTYQQCKDMLKSVIGIEPSERTEAVYRSIRENR